MSMLPTEAVALRDLVAVKNAVKEHGVDKRGAWGRTALMEAVYAHAPIDEVVQWLISEGASPTVPDNFGKCALDYAPEEMRWTLRVAAAKELVSNRVDAHKRGQKRAAQAELNDRYKDDPEYGAW